MFNQMRHLTQADNGWDGSPLGDAVSRALAENGDLSAASMRAGGFRALAPMTDRAQVLVDTAVMEVGLQRLTLVKDLMDEGLVFNLNDPLSVTQLEWNSMGKLGAAQRVMLPGARYENKLPVMAANRIPIYITMDGFNLNVRVLKTSQRAGIPLDVSIVKQCVRSVNEAIEDAAINGATTLDGQAFYHAGYTAPGLINAPGANTYSITVRWDDAAATAAGTIGAKILADVQGMVAKNTADRKYGPYNLYVSTAYGMALDNDFKANGELTIRQRIEQLTAGGRPIRVRVADFLPTTTVVLLQMTSDVVDVINGMPPTVIPYTSIDGFVIHNLVMAVVVTRVRVDSDGASGVCVGTTP